MIYQIKKGDTLELKNDLTSRKLRVISCQNREMIFEYDTEPIYRCEIIQNVLLTRKEINILTGQENCLNAFLN